MEQELNNVFDTFNVKAKCVGFNKLEAYQFYDCYLTNNGRIKDIVSIEKEIQINLKLPNINIKYVPDSSSIRIETFFKRKENIYYQDISTASRKTRTTCFLGKDYFDNIVKLDIAKCPHLLIGGSSGSGKTVLLNTIIRNLLETNIKLFLFDPKTIEFNKHENSESNVNVFYSMDSIISTLEYLISLMESNFSLIRKYGDNSVSPSVLVIDEYADLYMKNKNISDLVCKLAQKARSAKIHIILATQRPSVNVISGDIKVNFPARIALKTASSFDSRTIIDEDGAENLFGKGDAILKNDSDLFRFQVAV